MKTLAMQIPGLARFRFLYPHAFLIPLRLAHGSFAFNEY